MWTLSRSGPPTASRTAARLRMVRSRSAVRSGVPSAREAALEMVRRWFARIGVVVATLLAGMTTAAVPAGADGPVECARAERVVYGITVGGGLVQHTFCLDGNLSDRWWLDSSPVTGSGWADTAYAFWSG